MKQRKLVAICAALAIAAGALGAEPRAVFPPFAHAPLDGPLVVTGSFGEYRPGRFHAGMDYSTGGHVGMPVYAPLDGWIERIRASGAGYGRSIYVHAPDGRSILLGHLDAYNEPFASYVAAAQDSSGQYEQDLWPERTRFPVHAGQILGWSGQSGGIGEPHLHLEVRRGDMAIHPLLAGASAVDDSMTPTIAGIMIEPRGTTSTVNGRDTPLRLEQGARPETVSVFGFARIEVEAHDPGVRRSNMQPYEIEMSWGGHRVACRFDSLSWATDMVEGDLVYDRGRVFEARVHAVPMWAPADFRPRAIVTDVPLDQEAGTLGLIEKARIETVRIAVRDFAGRSTERNFVVRFEPPNPAVPQPRISVVTRTREERLEGFGWLLASYGSFDGGTSWQSVVAETLGTESAAGDLVPIGRAIHIGPDWMPFRVPFSLRASVPVQAPDQQLGLYVRRDSGWELLATEPDTTRMRPAPGAQREGEVWLQRPADEWARPSWIAHPTHLGQFAFFYDSIAPRVTPLRPPHHRGAAKPYSHWALEARFTEAGSGVDSRASYFIVDGSRRPSEWDGVHQRLRWKPLHAPRVGSHHYVVVAADRAGNVSRASGAFVIN